MESLVRFQRFICHCTYIAETMVTHQIEALTKLTALREMRRKQTVLEQQKEQLVAGLGILQRENHCMQEYQVKH